MACKDGGFSLNQRQQARYNRYEKQLASILEKHLATVKQIDKDWAIFKEQNSKALNCILRHRKLGQKDSHYQLNVNESANFKLINDKLEHKSERLVEESNKYKGAHKLLVEERDKFYTECVGEWEREQKGKGLYDTDSESSTGSENLETIHLDRKGKGIVGKRK